MTYHLIPLLAQHAHTVILVNRIPVSELILRKMKRFYWHVQRVSMGFLLKKIPGPAAMPPSSTVSSTGVVR